MAWWTTLNHLKCSNSTKMSRPILGDKTMRTLWSRFTKKWHVKECKKGHKAIANSSFCYRTVNSKVAIRLLDNQQTNAAPTGSEPCHWPQYEYCNIISSLVRIVTIIRMQWSSYRLLTIAYLYHISYDMVRRTVRRVQCRPVDLGQLLFACL